MMKGIVVCRQRHRARWAGNMAVGRHGFTLVELLAVIAIIALLMGLLLPAVQSVRESARQVACSNNIRNLAQAFEQHAHANGHFPTGGWGDRWTGHPDRGTGARQPGGWTYNVLPYCEQKAVWELPLTDPGGPNAGAAKMILIGLPLFNCPSRRGSERYPSNRHPGMHGYGSIAPADGRLPKCDYAANGGDRAHNQPSLVSGGWAWIGPPTFAAGEAALDPAATDSWRKLTDGATGIVFCTSMVKPDQVLDGLSNTFLVGEKYLNPDAYFTGTDGGDNEGLLMGDNPDISRFSAWAPQQDRRGVGNYGYFGSAHANAFGMAFADGSVRRIAYDVNADLFRWLGNRRDGREHSGSGL